MESKHTEEELICSFKSTEFGKLKEFLSSLALSSENADFLDIEGKQLPQGVWPIETDENEYLIVVISKTQGHVFLKRKGEFEKLRKKLFHYFSF